MLPSLDERGDINGERRFEIEPLPRHRMRQRHAPGMQRLARKHDTARQYVPTAVIDETAGARLGVICYGTTRYAIEEARDRLAREGVAFDLMRVRALPFGAEVEGFIARHDDLLVIEMNRDNQLRDILRAELPQHAANLHGVGYIDGMPLTAEWVERQLLAHLSGRAD